MAAQSGTSRTRSVGKPAVWQTLEDHYETMRGLHLRNLFADDPARGRRMTAEAAGVFLDYSKNRINDETLKLLVELAKQSELRARIDAMFRGQAQGRSVINNSSDAHLSIPTAAMPLMPPVESVASEPHHELIAPAGRAFCVDSVV